MNEHSVTIETAAPQTGADKDAFDRLTSLGWSGGLAAIVAGLAVSFLLFGYALVYWRNADMDFMVIYSALAMNAGKPQQFLDHTAYLTILSVKSWFQLLHGLGLLDATTLPAMPPASDASAFDAAMTQAVRGDARAQPPKRSRCRFPTARRKRSTGSRSRPTRWHAFPKR